MLQISISASVIETEKKTHSYEKKTCRICIRVVFPPGRRYHDRKTVGKVRQKQVNKYINELNILKYLLH